jgi:type IV pilus biogenesis protein CpaD/CtpE
VIKHISGILAAAAIILVPLAGCEHSLVAQNMGNAYRENLQAQIANPEAARANEPGVQGIDPHTGEDVVNRYHKTQKSGGRTAAPMIVTTGSR